MVWCGVLVGSTGVSTLTCRSRSRRWSIPPGPPFPRRWTRLTRTQTRTWSSYSVVGPLKLSRVFGHFVWKEENWNRKSSFAQLSLLWFSSPRQESRCGHWVDTTWCRVTRSTSTNWDFPRKWGRLTLQCTSPKQAKHCSSQTNSTGGLWDFCDFKWIGLGLIW